MAINGSKSEPGPSALPPANTARWVKSRKKAVLDAIAQGRLTEEDAIKRYNLSAEELQSWRRMLNSFGPEALRTTHLKRYRKKELRDQSFRLIGEDEHGLPLHQ